MKKLAWIGTGHMGLPMAANLLKAGYELQVYNRTEERAEPLKQQGAVICRTPGDTVQDTAAVFIMLTQGDTVQTVLEGDNGILSSIAPGTLVVNMSTIGPDEAKEFGRLTEDAGGIYVDAPVSGSVGPAENGQLVILAGGTAEAVEICQPWFDVLGKNTIHFGEIGTGSSAKLAINLLLGIVAQGISESLLAGEMAGLEREKLLQMIGESAVATPLLAGKKNMFLTEEFPAAFMISLLAKDLRLLMKETERTGFKLPLAEATSQTYASANRSGKGELDMAGIWLELKEQNRE